MKASPNDLMLLVEIIDAGSIAQAARQLGTTRANLSLKLKVIEADFGAQLIRRSTRELKPTPMGRKLYARGLAIRDEFMAAAADVVNDGGGLSGSVHLCVPTGYGAMVLTPMILAFRALHPGVMLSVTFENGVDNLVEKNVDVSVRVLTDPPPDVIARKATDIRYLLCMSPATIAALGKPLTPDSLTDIPLFASDFLGAKGRVLAIRGAERCVLAVQPHLTSSNFMFLRQAILQSTGCGFLPDYMVRNDLQEGRMVTVLDDWKFDPYGASIYIVRRAERFLSPASTALVEFLTLRLREHGGGATPVPD